LKRKQSLIDAKTYIAKHIIDKFSSAAVQTIQRMHSKFYTVSASELDSYAAQLTLWIPSLDANTWNGFLSGMINPKPQLLTAEQMQSLLDEVILDQRPKLSAEWVERMSKERDGLVELVPSRKMELERIAGDEQAKKEADARIEQERIQREANASKDKEEMKQGIETASEVDKLNASFDQASEATPVVDLAKGTVVKRKYLPKSHSGWVAIIQSWVTNDMNKMTLDELSKKLSFMKTACEGRLNKGEELKAQGLEIEEDFSTRTTRKKEAAVA
jgi:hypothetical protein